MTFLIKKEKVLYPDLSFKVYGICFSTHNQLGRFRSEKSYADSIEQLLKENNIQYKTEFSFAPSFVGESDRRNVVDFLIENKIVLEIKALPVVSYKEYYQLQRYLKASKIELGILVNFQSKYLRPKRILNTELYSEYSDSNS